LAKNKSEFEQGREVVKPLKNHRFPNSKIKIRRKGYVDDKKND
jgi:hypothetical protein